MSKAIRIPVVGGLVTLIFGGPATCGSNPETRPGISFDLESDMQLFPNAAGNPRFYGGTGVISRADARALAAELIRIADAAEQEAS